jgi:hypothetical protein
MRSQISKCEEKIQNLTAEIIQANSQKFGQITQKLIELKKADYPNVDKAYDELKELQPQIFQTISETSSKLQKWDQERKQLESIWLELNHEMVLISENIVFSKKPELNTLLTKFDEIKSSYQIKNLKKLVTLKDEFLISLEIFKKQTIDETVRKNVVNSLIQILKEMKFEIAKPKLQTLNSGVSQVLLKGALPNGELVTFQIDQDGKTHFELENFQQTYCKDRIELIRTDLEKKMSSKVEIEQWEWHNPDLMKSGFKDLPKSGPYMYKSTK